MKAWLQDLPFLLRGPPGCGKKHLLLQAVGRQYSLFDLGMISNSEGTIQSMLQKVVDTHSLNKAVDEKQGPDGKPDPDTQQTLLALYGCEHLTVEGAKFLRTRKVVLMASDWPQHLDGHFSDRRVWLHKLTDGEMATFLRAKFRNISVAKRKQIILHSDGDMRRAVMQFHHRSDPICYQGHAKLDCEAALYRQSGQRQETICFPAANWIHHNADLVSPDLKDYK